MGERAGLLLDGVGLDAVLFLDLGALRLRGMVDALAGLVEYPAVVYRRSGCLGIPYIGELGSIALRWAQDGSDTAVIDIIAQGRYAIYNRASALAIINPRRACAARVTVVVLSVCLYVCLSEHAILAVRAVRSITKDAIVLRVRFAAILKRRFS